MSRYLNARNVLAVQELTVSTQYYTNVLGFTRDPVDAKRWAFLSRDSFQIMLGECADDVSAAEIGSHSWFVRIIVDELDNLHRELMSRGAEIISEPATRGYGLREFVIRTPDGHRIMFAEPVRPERTAE